MIIYSKLRVVPCFSEENISLMFLPAKVRDRRGMDITVFPCAVFGRVQMQAILSSHLPERFVDEFRDAVLHLKEQCMNLHRGDADFQRKTNLAIEVYCLSDKSLYRLYRWLQKEEEKFIPRTSYGERIYPIEWKT